MIEFINNITEDCTIKITGAIDENKIFEICKVLRDSQKDDFGFLTEEGRRKFNIDLSGTTGLAEIPFSCFYCIYFNLKTILIPDGVIKIESQAFYGCESLEEITIPSGVTFIGRRIYLQDQ